MQCLTFCPRLFQASALLLAANLATATVHLAGDMAAFGELAATLAPGDVLRLADGVYANARVGIPASGTRDAPIVVEPATPGGVLLRLDTRIVVAGHHVTLRGFRFEHCGPGPVVTLRGLHNRLADCVFRWCGNPASTFTHIVTIEEGAHDAEVDHCLWEGSKSMSVGVRVRGRETMPQRPHIHRNVFRDIERYSSNGQEAVQLGQGGPSDQWPCHGLVEGNVFDHASGDAEFISNKTSNNTYRYNVAVNCNAALVLRGGNDAVVEGNLFVNNSTGLRIHGARHRVLNNVFVDMRSDAILLPQGGRDYGHVLDCVIAHNTVINPGRHAVTFPNIRAGHDLVPRGNLFVNNLFSGNRAPLINLNGAIANRWQTNLLDPTGDAVPGHEDGGLRVAPALLRMALPEIGLEPGSPAIDRGTVPSPAAADFDGRDRAADAAPDIGAVEAGAPIRQPVARPELPTVRPRFDMAAWRGSPIPLPAEPEWLMTDTEIRLTPTLPADLMLSWEYRPATLASAATVALGPYSFTIGGGKDRPTGTVRFHKSQELVGVGHDTVLSARSTRTPETHEVWYKASLLRCGARLRLEFDGVGVMVWDDHGLVGGPPPAGGEFVLRQQGSGTWRNLQAWTARAPTTP